jgi:protein bicaudal D
LEAVEQLKAIAEKNLAEALEMLQQEREQRHNLKKELDQRVSSEAVYGLQTLVSLGLGDFKTEVKNASLAGNDTAGVMQPLHVDELVDNPALKKIEADFTGPRPELIRQTPAPAEGLVGDLFSEVHVGQIRKLERLLEQTEIEKCNLEQALEQSSILLAEAKAEAVSRNTEVIKLKAELEARSASASTNGIDQAIVMQFPSYELAVHEISVLRNELAEARAVISREREARLDANELKLSHKDLVTYKERIARLETDVSDNQQLTDELKQSLCQTKNGLLKTSQELSHLYQSVCRQASESPNKTLTQSNDASGSPDELPAIACFRLLELVGDQVHYITCAFNRLTELSNAKTDSVNSPAGDEAIELQEQVIFKFL